MYRVRVKFLQNVILNGVLYNANSEGNLVLTERECIVYESNQILSILSKTKLEEKVENTELQESESKPKQERVREESIVKTTARTTRTRKK